MSIVKDKSDILTQLSTFTSLRERGNQPKKRFNNLQSVNNSNDIVPFLLDVLTIIVGSKSLINLTGRFFTEFFTTLEPLLKTTLKSNFNLFNSNNIVSTWFVDGVTIPLSKIDVYKKLKINPTSPIGETMYGSTTSFDFLLYSALVTPNTDITINNIIVNYSPTLDSIVIKPLNTSETIGTFISNYIDGLEIINKKQITSEVLNNIFGSVDASTNKTQNNIIEEENINFLLNKLLDDEDVMPEISFEDKKRIEEISLNKALGINKIDVGCGFIDNNISINEIATISNNVNTQTNPNIIGAQFDGLINNSVSENSDVNNKDNIKDGFFKRLIRVILSILIKLLTFAIQIRILLFIVNGFKNNGDIGSGSDSQSFIRSNRKLIQCIIKELKRLFVEFIFNILKNEIIRLIVPIQKIILKEKILGFVGVIRSLIR